MPKEQQENVKAKKQQTGKKQIKEGQMPKSNKRKKN